MIKIKLDVTKIPKDKIFVGKKGKYIDLVLFENRDGEDQYGNLGFCAMDTTKDERGAGEKGAILGNWREIGDSKQKQRSAPPARQQPASQPKAARDPDLDPAEDDIPF